MKLNKKMMAVYLLASFLVTESAMARLVAGDRKPTAGDSSSPSGNSRGTAPSDYKVSQAPKDNYQVVQGNTSTCDSDNGKEKYFPQSLFPLIARDEGAKIDISVRPNNKIVVKVPPTINVCGQWIPEIRQDKVTRNVTILMKLNGTKYTPAVDADGKPILDDKKNPTYTETKDQLLSNADFETCLAVKHITDNGKIDYSKVPSNGYSESVTTFDYDFDKKTDVKKTATISYGYPKSYNSADGYSPMIGLEDNSSVPGEACMVAEKVAEKPVYINEGYDVQLQRLQDLCKAGDSQAIADARANLGNYDALKSVADRLKQDLDAGYLNAVIANDLPRINKDMKSIEDKLNKEKDTMDESTAKKQIEKYAALTQELNTKFLDPAIMRLDSLMQKRAKLDDDDPKMKDIDDQIKTLNDQIGQFSKRNPTSFASIYSVMEKYAINDSAKTIEDIRLKSYLYSKVYAGKMDERRGKPMTFEAANQKQYTQLQKFDKTLTDWTDVYLVGQGNTYPIKKVEKERQASIDRMNTRWAAYEKKESTDYANYCGVGMLGSVKNPVKCQEWSTGLSKRRDAELKKRTADLNYIKGRNDKLEKMGTNYNEHQRQLASRQESEDDGLEPYGSSYTSYDDNFSDRFPGYYGPTTTTAYNAANYNMGGMSNSMQMGQQQSYMMPQQQMQQGQFSGQLQMGQGQVQSGWPGI